MRYKLAILFTQPPFGTSANREGLDALLAATAFCDEDDIVVGFIHDGVFALVAGQDPEQLGQKDHLSTFKLLELYDINHCFVCQDSVAARGLNTADWQLGNLQFVPRATLLQELAQAPKLLTF